jgi:hypothetical protein
LNQFPCLQQPQALAARKEEKNIRCTLVDRS